MNAAEFLSKAWEVVEGYEYDARARFRRTVANACARAGVPFDDRIASEIVRSEEADWTEIEQGYLSKLDLLREAQLAMRVSEDRDALFSTIEDFIPQDPADENSQTAMAVSEVYRLVGRDDDAAPWTQRAIDVIESLKASKRWRSIILLGASGIETEGLWDDAFEEMSDMDHFMVVKRLLEEGETELALRMIPRGSDLPPGKASKYAEILHDNFGVERALEFLEAAEPEERIGAAKVYLKLGDAGVRSITKHLDEYPADKKKMRTCETLANELDDPDFAVRAVSTAEEIPDEMNMSDWANVIRLHRVYELDGFEEALERFLTKYNELDDEGKASAQKYSSGNLIMAGEEAVERFAEVAVDPEELRERFQKHQEKPTRTPSEPTAKKLVHKWKHNLWMLPEDQEVVDATIEQALQEGKPIDRAHSANKATEILCHLDRLEAAHELVSGISGRGRNKTAIDFHRVSWAEIARAHAAKGEYEEAEKMLGEANALTAAFNLETATIPGQIVDRLNAVEVVYS